MPPAGEPRPGRKGTRRPPLRIRVTPGGLFAAAFLLLCGSVGAVVAGQLTAKVLGPWISMGYSAGAVLCAIAAVIAGRRR